MSDKTYSQIMAESMISTLVGGIVTGVFITPEDEYVPEGYGFTIKSADGKTRHVYVLMDEEGNGPGHLEIQEVQEQNNSSEHDGMADSTEMWHCNCSINYSHPMSKDWCSNCGLSRPKPENENGGEQ